MARKQYKDTKPANEKHLKFGSKSRKKKMARILALNKTCCIPVVKDHPTVYADGMGEWERCTYFDKMKKERIEWLNAHYSGKKNHKRSKPWYCLTSGKQYNYEEQEKSWGKMTAHFRVLSEVGKAYANTIIPKFTHEQYLRGVLKDTITKWEKSHPEPQQKIEGTLNAFYEEEITKWKADREQVWNDKQMSMKEKPQLAPTYVEHLHPELLQAA